jgi:hypothetical protein
MPIRSARGVVATILILAITAGAARFDEKAKPNSPALAMTRAVACRQIDGYEQFEPLPGAAITSEEKLKVYFRPEGYTIEREGDRYRARFTEDGAIRRKGEKKIIWKKDNLLDYEAKNDVPPYQVYLTNSIGLKGLPPGEYELDIILHDALREGATATQTLPFRIIPTPAAPPARDDSDLGKPPK